MNPPSETPPLWDVAIVGSGFAGSLLARCIASRGPRVVLLERDAHPREALGESTTPLASLSLERLADRYGFDDLRELATWGRASRLAARRGAGPDRLRLGKKRGFTFFGPRLDDRLLAAASPNDEVADMQWLRRDLDHEFARRAVAAGAFLRERCEVVALVPCDDGSLSVTFRDSGAESVSGTEETLRARTVIDAAGLAHAGRVPGITRLPEPFLDTLLVAGRVESLPPLDSPTARDPYPAERAAVHYLLPWGWLYVLRFDDDSASVGLVARRDELPASLADCEDPHVLLHHALASRPALREALAAAPVAWPWRMVRRVARRVDRAAVPGVALLPHAYAFFDPLFSTGIAWSLRGVERLAERLTEPSANATPDPATPDPATLDRANTVERTRALGAPCSSPIDAAFATAWTELLGTEGDHLATLLRAAWAAMDDPLSFRAVVAAYVASASWCESLERLLPRPDDAWQPLLGAGDPLLSSAFARLAERLAEGAAQTSAGTDTESGTESASLLSRTLLDLGPRDVAGLDQFASHDGWPVDLDVLLARADRLGLDRKTLLAALPRLRGEPTVEDRGPFPDPTRIEPLLRSDPSAATHDPQETLP